MVICCTVYVGRPDMKGREEILRVHTRKKPLADDVDLKEIARESRTRDAPTPTYSSTKSEPEMDKKRTPAWPWSSG